MEINQRIISEAARLFQLHGVRSVTMEDIASGLGISKRTLYECFEDKDHLLCAGIEQHIRDQNKVFHGFILESPDVIVAILRCYQYISENVRKTNISYFKELRKYHPAVYQSVVVKHHEESFRKLVYLIRRGQRAGLFLTSVNPRLVAALFHHRNDVLSSPEHHTSLLDEFSVVDIMEALIVPTIRGIATTKGIEVIDNYVHQHINQSKPLKNS